MTHRNVLQGHICAATKKEDILIKRKEKEKGNKLEKHVKGCKAFLHFLWTLMKERHRGLKTVYFRNRTENGAEARARWLLIP